MIIGLALLVPTRLQRSPESPATTNVSVNANARLAASGSPLPAPADEDVVVEQQQFDGRVYTLSFDFETQNWQLDFAADGIVHHVRYIVAEQAFFYYNPFEAFWDEVAAELLPEEIRSLAQVDNFLLSASQLTVFNQLALEVESEPCSGDASSLCAVWQAQNFADYQQTFIYVNQRTRKINQIVSFNQVTSATPLSATYSYEPVEVLLPDAARTRRLQ